MKLKTRNKNTQENLLTVINTIINPFKKSEKLKINTLEYNFSYSSKDGEIKKPTNSILF